MKHKDVNKLQYDGHTEAIMKKKSQAVYKIYLKTIDKIARQIQMQYPNENAVNFVEIAKRANELLQKRNSDEAIISDVIHGYDTFDGIEDFHQYTKAISYARNLTKKITIKYLNPIIPAKNGKPESFRTVEELTNAPVKSIVIEGVELNAIIEQAITASISEEALKTIRANKNPNAKLFGIDYPKGDQFYAQYSKAACKDIYKYLQSFEIDDKSRKSMTVLSLEIVGLISNYYSYSEEIENKGEKPQPRSTWESRIFVSLMR
jgi:hypothetical protein